MTKQHAKLSPSGAARWMNCPGSVAMEAELPDTGKASIHAAEGTVAHDLAELCLRTDTDAIRHIGKEYTQDGFDFTVDDDMARFVQHYVDYVRDIPGKLLIEQRVDFSEYVPGGFGTADAIIMHDGTMYVVDLKFGRGVQVDAENNPQAMCYALGALNDYGFLYDVTDVRMVIVQPRLDHISEWDISADDLQAWATGDLAPAADLALSDGAPVTPGEKQCRWCRAQPVCRELAEYHLAIASDGFGTVEALADPVDPTKLSNTEIGGLIPHLNAIGSWIKAVEAYALGQLEQGEDVPGYKLVEGRSNRKWVDDDEAEAALRRTKLKVGEIFNQKLISPTQAGKLLPKGHKVMDLIIKPQGKPTIALLSDKRPAIDVNPAEGFEAVAAE